MKALLKSMAYGWGGALRSVALQKAYRAEYLFFESLRARSYTDPMHLAAQLRSATHQLDKKLGLSADVVAPFAAGRKRISDLLERYRVLPDADRGLVTWSRGVLDEHERRLRDRSAGAKDAAAAVSFTETETSAIDRLIRTRRSIRAYASSPLEHATVRRILEAGLWAPSGCNRQNVEYLVLRDKDDLQYCQRLAGEGHAFPSEAPVGVVVLVDPRAYALPGQRHMAYLEAGAAVQNMLLTAHALGVGTCWLNWSGRNASHREFTQRYGLKPWLLPVAMVCVGYAAKLPPFVPARKGLDGCMHERGMAQV